MCTCATSGSYSAYGNVCKYVSLPVAVRNALPNLPFPVQSDAATIWKLPWLRRNRISGIFSFFSIVFFFFLAPPLYRSRSDVSRKTMASINASLVSCYQLAPPSTWTVPPFMKLWPPSLLRRWTACHWTLDRSSQSGKNWIHLWWGLNIDRQTNTQWEKVCLSYFNEKRKYKYSDHA